MLQISNLSGGYYPGRDVLRDVSLCAKPGTLVSMVGANGAGKSTLINAIFGMVPYCLGSITLNNESLLGYGPDRVANSGVRMVPENRGTLPSLSVLENLQLGGLGLSKKVTAERIERELERFPRLKERLSQRAGMLSGGEQQMLAISRALICDPCLLLLDEPSQGLAPVMVEQIFTMLASLRGSDQIVLLVEQDVTLSLEISDYAYVVEKGCITKEGLGSELIDDPHVREAFLGLG